MYTGTNIHEALMTGIDQMDIISFSSGACSRPTLLVFLTDGRANQGITRLPDILSEVNSANDASCFSIFTLGFGSDIQYEFLQQVSLMNDGFARKIYADDDAAAQLEQFYEEIASPLLSDIEISVILFVIIK